jgi:hypothetical protein
MHAGSSLHFSSIYWSKKMKEIQFLLLSLVNLTGAPAPIAGRCRRERKCVFKENSERCHSRMPVNIIFFIRLLLFCCMILFLTVLWLHQY